MLKALQPRISKERWSATAKDFLAVYGPAECSFANRGVETLYSSTAGDRFLIPNAALTALRDSLSPRLVSGRLRVGSAKNQVPRK